MRRKGLRDLMRDYERMLLTETLKRNGGSRQVAADVLGITVRALEKKLEKHRLVRRPRFTRALPIPTEGTSDE